MRFRFHTRENGVVYIEYNKVYDKECTVELTKDDSYIKRKIKHEKLGDKQYHHYIVMPNGEKIDFFNKDKIYMKEIQRKLDNKKCNSYFTDELFQAILTIKPKNAFFVAPCTMKKQKLRANYENGRKPGVLCNVAKFDKFAITLHPLEDESVKDTEYEIADFINRLNDTIIIDHGKHKTYYDTKESKKSKRKNKEKVKDTRDPFNMYFELSDGYVIRGADVITAAKINGLKTINWDAEDIIKYASCCTGIKGECEPSITQLIEHNQYVMAICLYYKTNSVSITQARDAIDKIKNDLKKEDRA